MSAIDHDDLLLLLEDGPQHVSQLSVWLKAPLLGVVLALRDLASLGVVHQVGDERRWAIVSVPPPAAPDVAPSPGAPTRKARAGTSTPGRAVPRARPTPSGSPDEDELDNAAIDAHEAVDDGDPDPDTDLLDELLAPPRPRRPGRPPRALRQPHERPSQVALSKDRAPAWWVGLSREAFAAESRRRQTNMSASREAKMVGAGRRLD